MAIAAKHIMGNSIQTDDQEFFAVFFIKNSILRSGY